MRSSPIQLIAAITAWSLLALAVPLASSAGCLESKVDQLNGQETPSISRYLTKNFAERNPKAVRALQSKALERWKRSKDPTWKKLRDSIARCVPPITCKINLLSENVGMYIEVSTKNGTMEVRVKNVQIISPDNTALPHGLRPDGLNTSFANLFGSMMGGIAKKVASSPQISRVKIVGDNVLNQPLAKLLSSYGFRKSMDLSRIRDSVISGKSAKVAGTAVSIGTGQPKALTKSVKIGTGAATGGIKIRHGLQSRYDWVLDFEVKAQ